MADADAHHKEALSSMRRMLGEKDKTIEVSWGWLVFVDVCCGMIYWMIFQCVYYSRWSDRGLCGCVCVCVCLFVSVCVCACVLFPISDIPSFKGPVAKH